MTTPTLDWRAAIDVTHPFPQVNRDTADRIETLCDAVAVGLYRGGLAAADLESGGQHPDLPGLCGGASGMDVVIAHVRQAIRPTLDTTRMSAELMLARKAVLWLATQITASVVMGDSDWPESQVVTGVVHLRESLYDYAAEPAAGEGE